MPKINSRSIVSVLVTIVAIAAVAHTVDLLSPRTTQPEYQQLAKCSGIFMAASVESQDDEEMTKTFTWASKLSLTLARDTVPQGVDSLTVNQLGLDTMIELLKYSEKNPKSGHLRIAQEMEQCVQLLNSIPTTEHI